MNLLTRYLLLILALATPLAAPAEPPAPAANSMLSVVCEGDDVGAEVSINGKFKGECPVDIHVAPGTLKLRVEKKGASRERVFEQKIRIGDGVVKKIDAVLATHLDAAEQKHEEERQAAEAARKVEADLAAARTIPTSIVNEIFESAKNNDSAKLEELKGLASQGNADAQAGLARIYFNGWGVTKDYAEALTWARKAADQGHSDGQNVLGAAYDNGQGVAKDETEAVKWFRKGAEQGNARAQTNLGLMYANGQGVAKDETEAVKWYRKAADQGFAIAQTNLGRAYTSGHGIAKDDVEGIKWFRKAAEQGYGQAQYGLGGAYYFGFGGVAKDEAEGVKWIRKAAEQGDVDAQSFIKALTVQQQQAQAAQQHQAQEAGGVGNKIVGAFARNYVNQQFDNIIGDAQSQGLQGRVVAQGFQAVKDHVNNGQPGQQQAQSEQTSAQQAQGGAVVNSSGGSNNGANGMTTAQLKAAAQKCKAATKQETGNPQVDAGCSLVAFDVCIYKTTGVTNYNPEAKNQCAVLQGAWGPNICQAPCSAAANLPIGGEVANKRIDDEPAVGGNGTAGGYTGLSSGAVDCYDTVMSRMKPSDSAESNACSLSHALVCLRNGSSSPKVNANILSDAKNACRSYYENYPERACSACYKGGLRVQ